VGSGNYIGGGTGSRGAHVTGQVMRGTKCERFGHQRGVVVSSGEN
jgi:hypothetical protein